MRGYVTFMIFLVLFFAEIVFADSLVIAILVLEQTPAPAGNEACDSALKKYLMYDYACILAILLKFTFLACGTLVQKCKRKYDEIYSDDAGFNAEANHSIIEILQSGTSNI